MLKTKTYLYTGLLLLGAAFSCTNNSQESKEELKSSQAEFKNLLNIKNTPANQKDRDCFAFSDNGAWTGYALPQLEGRTMQGAFIGPYLMSGRGWMAISLAEPQITLNGAKYDLARNIQTTTYFPGKLEQIAKDRNIHFTTELCYVNSNTALIRSVIKNIGSESANISLNWRGGVFNDIASLAKENDGIMVSENKDNGLLFVSFPNAENISLKGKDSLFVVEKESITLKPGEEYSSTITQTFNYDPKVIQSEVNQLSTIDPNTVFAQNSARWNGYINDVLSSDNKLIQENQYRNVAVKAMMTLVSNWRTPAGDLLHDGSYPSYNGFFGIWSWDSWKHISANALYNPEQAKNEMRCLFDYQAENGMIPDFVSRNKARNNWRDTKPPLSAWALTNIYNATEDKEFVAEMFDKIYKYHRWWYSHRDHDGNGICEYGSTDGTLIAACWESGMDNGVRFDGAVMLQNAPEKAWSMNQENICLNSFLYAEKNYLAELAQLLGKNELRDTLLNEANVLKTHIQTKMYDTETGFFYDTKLGTGEFVKVMGAECWLPLWAGVATDEQAKSVLGKMLDPNKFNSVIPLGTLDISHPDLRATRGYWRGPVWIDQVYFGVTGLRKYGYNKEADEFVKKYIQNAQGLLTDGPIHENYNPLTGETLNCPNFGWSSALTIKMLVD